MDKIEWIAPCHFGLESVLKREVEQLGYEIVQVEDGRVTFRGGAEAVCRANIFFVDCGACIDESRQFSGKDI